MKTLDSSNCNVRESCNNCHMQPSDLSIFYLTIQLLTDLSFENAHGTLFGSVALFSGEFLANYSRGVA